MKVSSIFIIASGIAIANGQELKHHSIRRRQTETMSMLAITEQKGGSGSRRTNKSSTSRSKSGGSYDWLVGDYIASKSNQLLLIDGEVPPVDLPLVGSQTLEVTRLGDDASANIFRATYVQDISGIPISPYSLIRLVYEGVGSLNPRLQDEITFYTDNLEYQLKEGNGRWFQFDQEEMSDTSSLRCSRLPNDKDGSSIACEVYENEVFLPSEVFPQGVSLEVIASNLWVTDTSE